MTEAGPATNETQGNMDSRTGWLRRLWPIYCLLVVLVTAGYAKLDPYLIDGDAVSYMDIGDLIHSHQWAGVVDGYWHPLYPAALMTGKAVFHADRWTELAAYYKVNFAIFLLEMLAVVLFADAITKLRDAREKNGGNFLLGRYAARYFGLALLVIASQRELSLGRVRPDALLQALLLLGFAAVLTYLRTSKLVFVALAGLAMGLGFLTKSFAFPMTLVAVALLVGFSLLWKRQTIAQTAIAAAVMLACFALVAGPYVAALSKQKGRLSFGESGSLNYAWYVGGTEKMHLQNGTPEFYGTSEVHLKHPETILQTSPVVASYEPFPYGTYPPWFDATYFNDRIKTHVNWPNQLRTFKRDTELIVRYLLNHPEGWILLLMLGFVAGAAPDLCRRFDGNGFWVVPLVLGIAIFGIYWLVNIEERYVTVGWIAIALTLAVALRTIRPNAKATAASLIVLLALLATGESLRTVLQLRRDQSVAGLKAGWYEPKIFRAAEGLNAMGVRPGDKVACAGTNACLYDIYWARLAGVRIMTEIYLPEPHPYASLKDTPNLAEALDTVRRTGAKVIVARLDPAVMSSDAPETRGWVALGGTDYYALPLNLPNDAVAGGVR